MSDINIELGGGKAEEAIDEDGTIFSFETAARTVSVVNTGSVTVYVACGSVTAAALAQRMTDGTALPILAGRAFTFEATYPRLRGLGVITSAGETGEVAFGAF